jgi:hypothetical protein
VAVLGVGGAVIKLIAERHAEYVSLMAHVRKEEHDVWPSVKALDAKLTGFHTEVLALHALHGERLAAVEARMPNGQIKTIQRSLDALADKIDALGQEPRR